MSDIATKKLEDQLTCAICLEQYKDPRSLSCLHSFCTRCLEGLPREDEGENETVSCPSCRATTRILLGKITVLPIAFHVNNLLEVQDLLQKSSGSNAVCSNCPQEKAKFYCPDCDKFLCSSCNDFHGRWSSFSTHKVMGIEEVANKATKMVSVKPTPPMECPSHAEALKVYCIKCDQPICYLCTIKDHKGHDHTLVDDAYKECKQKIRERITLLEEEVQTKKEINKELEESKKDVQKKAKIHKTKINNICDDFVEKIEKVRRLGLQAVEGGTASYIACKDHLIEEEEAAIQALNDCKEYVECSIEKSTPPQLMLMKKQITERFEELAVPESVVKMDQVAKPIIYYRKLCSDEVDLDPVALTFPLQFSTSPPMPKQDLPYALTSPSQSYSVPMSLHPMPQQDSNELTVKDLKKNIFSFVPLQYPQLAYKQCELVADFPKDIQVDFLCTATFALLFKGHSMIVDVKDISCFLELLFKFRSSGRQRPKPQRKPVRSKVSWSGEKDEYPCNVDYSHDDIKYQVSFTPPIAGTYSFHVKIGSTIVSSKIEIKIQNSQLRSVAVYEGTYN